MVLLLYLREAAFGGLQGVQSFVALSLVQVVQAALRVAGCAVLVAAGLGAVGAILAQPLAAAVCVALSVGALAPHLRGPRAAGRSPVDWHYSFSTLVGLVVFGLLTNVDALFVRRVFDAQTAANYAPVVTLAKIALFVPWAIGLVLFPKVAKRSAAGQDTRPVLLAALAAALSPGLAVSGVFFLAPGLVVGTTFGPAYANPGAVLGAASVAATLFAGVHIWLNYALSSERRGYVWILAGVLAWQVAGMWLFGRGDLLRMTLVMVSAGLLANVAGALTTWSRAPAAGLDAELGVARR
jgi:O-antigen/teichoic acid export membrane protein